MHINLALVAGSAVVGFLVGLTGMGGGALMTPMLVLLFGVTPSAAISSDLVAALFMKPVGVAIHFRRRTIQTPIVKWLSVGSVPAALLGTFLLKCMGTSTASEKHLQVILGSALVVGAVAMVVGIILPRRSIASSVGHLNKWAVVGVGVIGGFMVGLTSVGAGSLIMILLVMLYPSMRSDHLVGTDLAQSLPLTAAATVGALLFGHVHFGVTLSIIIGSVPTVLLASFISSKNLTAVMRPYIAGIALLSGLKYVGLSVTNLAVAAVIILLAATALALRTRRGTATSALSTAPELATVSEES